MGVEGRVGRYGLSNPRALLYLEGPPQVAQIPATVNVIRSTMTHTDSSSRDIAQFG